MFEWKELGATWTTEQAYQALELLKQNRVRCRMPADDMFFTNPFFLPHPDRRWAIQVRRRDMHRAMALLAREGLARIAEETDRREMRAEGKQVENRTQRDAAIISLFRDSFRKPCREE